MKQLFQANLTQYSAVTKINNIKRKEKFMVNLNKTGPTSFKTWAMILFILLICLAGSLPIKSQPSYVWGKQFGSDAKDRGQQVIGDINGNIIVAGSVWGEAFGPDLGLGDCYMVKYNTNGDVLWEKRFGTDIQDELRGMISDKYGNIYLCGYTEAGTRPWKFRGDIFFYKFDKYGNQIKRKEFGIGQNSLMWGIHADDSNNIIITGSTKGNLEGENAGNGDCFLMKLDSSLSEIFTIQTGTTEDDSYSNVTSDKDLNIYVSGNTSGTLGNESEGEADLIIAKYSKNGEQQWIKQLGTQGVDYGAGITLDKSGNIYAGGTTTGDIEGSNQGQQDIFLIKLNNDGEIIWKKQSGTSLPDWFNNFQFMPGSDNIITSAIVGFLGAARSRLQMFSSDGDIIWTQDLQSRHSNSNRVNDLYASENNEIYIIGNVKSNLFYQNMGNMDAFVVKFKLDDYSKGPLTIKNPIEDIPDYDSAFKIPENHMESIIENDTLDYIAMVAGTDKANNEMGIFNSTLIFDGTPTIDTTYNDSNLSDTILKKNNPLPDWLSFNRTTLEFTGMTDKEEELDIVLIIKNLTNHIIFDEFKLSVNKSSGIDQAKNDLILIYPIPAKDIINIEARNIPGIKYYQIIDIKGRVIKQGKLESETIDVSGINRGFYILNLQTGQRMLSKKITIE